MLICIRSVMQTAYGTVSKEISSAKPVSEFSLPKIEHNIASNETP